jgi:asparagine synthase (glutamine-hydrolysing)
MSAGFAVGCRDDHVEILLQGTPSLPGRSLVSIARDAPSQSTAALLGRLHYRDELLASLRQDHRQQSDAALALAVYLQAGLEGLKKLEGEFALVIWNGRDRRLIGIRDPLGSWPLFYSARGPCRAMSTVLGFLHGDDASPVLDTDHVAEFLTTPFISAEVTSTRTALVGARRVLPGTLVEVGVEGQVWQERYWDWASRVEPVRVSRLENAAERFRELLAHAVRERMRDNRIATHLSGGMDSSAVTVLARQVVAEAPARPALVTISLTHEAADLAAERSYMNLVLDQGGPVDPHFLSGDAAVGFDWFSSPLPPHDEPFAGLRSLAANRRLADVAQRCGIDTVLTGVGGDEILCYRPLHIADLLRRGRWLSGLREAARWGEAQGQGLGSVLRTCAIEPLWSSAGRALSRLLHRCGLSVHLHLGHWSIPTWLRPEFVRRHQLAERSREYSRRVVAPPAESSGTLMRLAMSSGDWARWHLHAPRGINISHPFLDPRVACYALGLPRQVRAVPGEPKPLLRAAMRGLLPEAIRERRVKTGFDGDHARGLVRHWAHLEHLVRNSPIQDLGLYDSEKLLSALHRLSVGIDGQQNQWLDRFLALLAWFEQRSNRRHLSAWHPCLGSAD